MVVIGDYQVVGNNIRIQARVLSVSSRQTVTSNTLRVIGNYPQDFFALMDKLVAKIVSALKSAPQKAQLTPLATSKLSYKQESEKADTTSNVEKEATITLINHSPFEAAFEFRTTDGRLYPTVKVQAETTDHIKLPSSQEFHVLVKSEGGNKAIQCRFRTSVNNEITYDSQVALLKIVNKSSIAIIVHIIQLHGATVDVPLGIGQIEILKVPPGRYSTFASAEHMQSSKPRNITLGVGLNESIEFKSQ